MAGSESPGSLACRFLKMLYKMGRFGKNKGTCDFTHSLVSVNKIAFRLQEHLLRDQFACRFSNRFFYNVWPGPLDNLLKR